MRIHEVRRALASKKAEIAAKKAELRALKARLRTKAEELPDGEDMPESDMTELDTLQAAVDALEAEADSLDTRVTRLEQLQEDDGDEADPVDPGPGPDVDANAPEGRRKGGMTPHGYGEAPRRQDKGFKAARFIIGQVIANKQGWTKASEIMERVYRDTAVAKALNTAGTATGGALIPQNFLDEIIELLRPQSVIRDLNPMIVDLSGGNMTIPRLTSAAVASYQGELDDMQASQEGFDDVQLNAKKLTGLVPVSNDLIRRAAINVEQTVRDDLLMVLALRQDLAMMLSDGSGGTPIGMLNLVTAANKLVALAFADNSNQTISGAVIGILNAMIASLRVGMSRMIRPAWITSVPVEMFLKGIRDGVGAFIFKDEMESGKLLGFPYRVTQQLPTNLNTATVQAPVNNGTYLFLADFADLIIGDTLRMQTDVSNEATYRDAGGNMVSAFTRDQTVIRVIDEHDFNIRHTASVAVAILPGWIPAGFGGVGPGTTYYVEPPRNDMSAAPSTWGVAAPTGSNNPGNIAANVPGGTQPGRV